MNLDGLHRLVRQLAGGDTAAEWANKTERLSEAERQAVRGLRRRLREAGGFAALAPVSGTSVWTAPPRAQAAE